MNKEAIKVYCRVKPVIGLSTTVEYEIENNAENKDTIRFFIPEHFGVKQRQNRSSSYNFTFNQIFDQDAEQEEVFEKVAKSVLENCLKGYNGTVFAYGQTASGKTYTISGEEFDDSVEKSSQMKRANQIKHMKTFALSEKNEVEIKNLSEISGMQQSDKSFEMDANVAAEAVGEHTVTTNEELGAINTRQQRNANSSGIIPRTISCMVSFFSDYETEAEMSVSYYEIYKESGYDLLYDLRQNHSTIDSIELTRIKAMTDANHKLHVKNLSQHKVLTEEGALEAFRHGNANRQIAATHHNASSSRSHCIFTIYLTVKLQEGEKTLHSKIHLVDLAGSERISKSQETSKKIVTEGKNINLSLHHLQQVIVSLSKRNLAPQNHKHYHVPYRNSIMTLILSDSLGGNSCTSMIATISADEKNLEESISTCRFAQQVATIVNKVVVNETQDAELVITRLQKELEEMKKQLALAVNRSPSPADSILTDIAISRLAQMVQSYLKDKDENAVLDVGTDRAKVQYCFKDMKTRWTDQSEINKKLQAALSAKQNKKSKTCIVL